MPSEVSAQCALMVESLALRFQAWIVTNRNTKIKHTLALKHTLSLLEMTHQLGHLQHKEWKWSENRFAEEEYPIRIRKEQSGPLIEEWYYSNFHVLTPHQNLNSTNNNNLLHLLAVKQTPFPPYFKILRY